MQVTSHTNAIWDSVAQGHAKPTAPSELNGPAGPQNGEPNDKVREAFQSFVGETLFGQMLKAMRKTVDKPAYFHGGRAEEMFQQQLDQVLAEKMANADGGKYSDAMYELFTLPRT